MDPFQIDPFGDFNPFAGIPRAGGARSRRSSPIQPLDPQVAEPLTNNLLSHGASLLHTLGSTLDKAFGARALRGIAAGRPDEALSIIPFSDSLGITDANRSVSMDDLLVQNGLVNPNDPTRWEARDFLVPVLEAAADPGTYLSFGAKTIAGQAASKLGKLPTGLRAGMRGFDAIAPELRAAGKSAEEISHLARKGMNIADDSTASAIQAATGAPASAGTPLRGLVGIGLPFQEPSLVFGSGAKAQRVAGVLDRVGDTIKYAPGVRQARALLDPAAGRSDNPIIQRAFERTARPVAEEIRSGAALADYGLRERFAKIMADLQPYAGSEYEALRTIRAAAEGAAQGSDPAAFLRNSSDRLARGVMPGVEPTDLSDIQRILTGHWGDLQSIGGDIADYGKSILDRSQRAGLDLSDLDDAFVEYVARRFIGSKPGIQAGNKILPTGSGSNIARKNPVRDLPGGTAQFDAWAMDPRLSGGGRTVDDKVAQGILSKDIIRNLRDEGTMITPDLAKQAIAKAKQVQGYLQGIGSEFVSNQIPFFNPNVFDDAISLRGGRAARNVSAAEALYDSIGMAARRKQSGDVSLLELAKQAGLKSHKRYKDVDPQMLADIQAAGFADAKELRKVLAASKKDPAALKRVAGLPDEMFKAIDQYDLVGAMPRMYEALAAKGVPFRGTWDNNNLKQLARTLSKYGVGRDQAEAMTRYMRSWLGPQEVEPVVKGIDSITNLFKAWSYSVWPASHVRNAVSAIYNNLIHGANFDDAKAAFQLMRENTLAPELMAKYGMAGMTPEQAASDLIGRAYAHAKVFTGLDGSRDVLAGTSGLPAFDPSAILPNLPGRGLAGQTGSFLGDTKGLLVDEGLKPFATTREGFNPLGVAGVRGATADTNALVKTGRHVGGLIEDFARLQSYLANLRRGMSDSAAGEMTRKIHFDYSDLTPFEKKVGRRLIPFYTFARKNLPYQIESLIRQPANVGIPLSVVDAANQGSYIPEYMQGGVAIKMGDEQNGTQRFLSSLGLPFEEAFGRIKMNGGLPDVSKTALSYMGTLNPLLKGPMEQIFDRQFHTGRQLSDLRPTGVGSLFGALDEDSAQPLAQFLANTPATRVISTIDKLIDERKGAVPKAMNLLSGFKIADVNMDKMRAIDAREVLTDLLRKNPDISSFTNFYVKPENLPKLSEYELNLLRLFALQKERAKQAVQHERAMTRPGM